MFTTKKSSQFFVILIIAILAIGFLLVLWKNNFPAEKNQGKIEQLVAKTELQVKSEDKYPDLIIQEIELDPNPVQVGKNTKLTVTIKNQGDASTGTGFSAAFYKDGTLQKTWTGIGTLNSGNTTDLTATFMESDSFLTHTISIIVDNNNVVNEGIDGETNNISSLYYRAVSQISFQDVGVTGFFTSTEVGLVKYYVQLSNVGQTAVSGWATLQIKDYALANENGYIGTPTTLSERVYIDLAPLGHKDFLVGQRMVLSPGSHGVEINYIPDETTPDTNAENNQMLTEMFVSPKIDCRNHYDLPLPEPSPIGCLSRVEGEADLQVINLQADNLYDIRNPNLASPSEVEVRGKFAIVRFNFDVFNAGTGTVKNVLVFTTGYPYKMARYFYIPSVNQAGTGGIGTWFFIPKDLAASNLDYGDNPEQTTLTLKTIVDPFNTIKETYKPNADYDYDPEGNNEASLDISLTQGQKPKLGVVVDPIVLTPKERNIYEQIQKLIETAQEFVLKIQDKNLIISIYPGKRIISPGKNLPDRLPIDLSVAEGMIIISVSTPTFPDQPLRKFCEKISVYQNIEDCKVIISVDKSIIKFDPAPPDWPEDKIFHLVLMPQERQILVSPTRVGTELNIDNDDLTLQTVKINDLWQFSYSYTLNNDGNLPMEQSNIWTEAAVRKILDKDGQTVTDIFHYDKSRTISKIPAGEKIEIYLPATYDGEYTLSNQAARYGTYEIKISIDPQSKLHAELNTDNNQKCYRFQYDNSGLKKLPYATYCTDQ